MDRFKKVYKHGFTTISNDIFMDDNLSLKARGLLCTMFSLPENWKFSERGLISIFKKDGQSAIRSGLKELEEAGYLKRERIREQGKIVGVDWIIYDSPHVENQNMENTSLENQPQYNNQEENKKEESKNISSSPLTPQGEKAGEEKPKPKKEKLNKDVPLVSLCKAYSTDPEVQALLLEWLDVRKQKRAVKSVNAIQRNLATLKDMAQQSGLSVKQYLEEVVRRGWQAFYVVPNYGNNSQQKRLPTEDDYCDLWG